MAMHRHLTKAMQCSDMLIFNMVQATAVCTLAPCCLDPINHRERTEKTIVHNSRPQLTMLPAAQYLRVLIRQEMQQTVLWAPTSRRQCSLSCDGEGVPRGHCRLVRALVPALQGKEVKSALQVAILITAPDVSRTHCRSNCSRDRLTLAQRQAWSLTGMKVPTLSPAWTFMMYSLFPAPTLAVMR